MPIHKEINRAFFGTWTHDMAYVLGFFAADGTMVRNNRGAHFIEFHITDHELLLKIQRALGSNHKVSPRIRDAKWKMGYRLQIGSKQMFADLERLGFTQNKSNSLKYPVIPKKYFGDFVRGYFDGDGCVYFRQHIVKDRKNPKWVFSSRFTSGTRSFLQTLLNQLRLRGIHGGFIVNKVRGFELVLSHHDSVALYGIMYNNGSLQGIYLDRKKSIFDKALQTLYKRV